MKNGLKATDEPKPSYRGFGNKAGPKADQGPGRDGQAKLNLYADNSPRGTYGAKCPFKYPNYKQLKPSQDGG